MKLSIASDDRDHAILVCDEDLNDIAEFYHAEHATVGQSYETALMLARKLVEASSEPVCETCSGAAEIDQRLGGMATSSVVPCPDCADDRAPQPLGVAQCSPERSPEARMNSARLSEKLSRIVLKMERTGDWRLSEGEGKTIVETAKWLLALSSVSSTMCASPTEDGHYEGTEDDLIVLPNVSPARCLTCGRSDKEFATGEWYCSDPWHGDDHLRAKALAHTSTEKK